MGLESINYRFKTKDKVKSIIESDGKIRNIGNQKYVLAEDNKYWIDIELISEFLISIRIALCNPQINVLTEFENFLKFLFLHEGVLTDLNTKKEYTEYDESLFKELTNSYVDRKKIFSSMYGEYTAAVSSEEFYRRINRPPRSE